MTPTDDRALVARAREGDQGAFEVLFRAHHLRVYNLVRQITGDSAQAEDVTQRAFVRAWEELPRLREPGAFAGWLNRVAANLARDVVRSPAARERSGGGVAEEVAEATQNGTAPVGERVEAGERDAKVHEAIATLPDHHRDVVLMHHIEGLPVKDVAGKLGVPVGTVLSRLARARDALRRKLAAYVE